MSKEIVSKSKKRSRAEKVGRYKYNQQLLKRVLSKIGKIEAMQRTIFMGLKGMFHFEKPLIQKIVCRDEVDEWILEVLFQAGSEGIFPKDIAAMLRRYKVDRHKVSRRINRMNKRLHKEIGQNAAEKRGHKWALTSFAFEIWGEAEEDIEL